VDPVMPEAGYMRDVIAHGCASFDSAVAEL
jgi:hypothetical protein